MDTVANMLTKIKNAQLAGHKDVFDRSSKIKLAISLILEKEGFVEFAKLERKENGEFIHIKLKYYKNINKTKTPAIQEIKKISKAGQRIYIKNKDIKPIRNNFGIGIISTPAGLMTNEDAKKSGFGGEYICEVW